jgi:hypothetical protein
VVSLLRAARPHYPAYVVLGDPITHVHHDDYGSPDHDAPGHAWVEIRHNQSPYSRCIISSTPLLPLNIIRELQQRRHLCDPQYVTAGPHQMYHYVRKIIHLMTQLEFERCELVASIVLGVVNGAFPVAWDKLTVDQHHAWYDFFTTSDAIAERVKLVRNAFQRKQKASAVRNWSNQLLHDQDCLQQSSRFLNQSILVYDPQYIDNSFRAYGRVVQAHVNDFRLDYRTTHWFHDSGSGYSCLPSICNCSSTLCHILSESDARLTWQPSFHHEATRLASGFRADEHLDVLHIICSKRLSSKLLVLEQLALLRMYLVFATIQNIPSFINNHNHANNTALHLCAKMGHELLIVFLRDSGADVNAVNQNGRTPQQMLPAGVSFEIRQLPRFFDLYFAPFPTFAISKEPHPLLYEHKEEWVYQMIEYIVVGPYEVFVLAAVQWLLSHFGNGPTFGMFRSSDGINVPLVVSGSNGSYMWGCHGTQGQCSIIDRAWPLLWRRWSNPDTIWRAYAVATIMTMSQMVRLPSIQNLIWSQTYLATSQHRYATFL